MTRALILCFALGCGSRVIADPESNSDTGVASSVDSAPSDVATEPTSLFECFGKIGDTDFAELKELHYEWETCAGGDGACMRTLRIGRGCQLELRRGDLSSVRTATASENDCMRLGQWATSERLLRGLVATTAEAKACLAAPGDLFESTSTSNNASDEPFALKSMFCNVEPFVTHRRCMQFVVKKYFK